MKVSESDVKVMVAMADSLHYLFFGILSKQPYEYLFPLFKQVQSGLTELARGNNPLDADVKDLQARIQTALDLPVKLDKAARKATKKPAKKSKGKPVACR